MRNLIRNIVVLITVTLLTSCFGNKTTNNSVELFVEKTNDIDIEKIKNMLCDNFPKELVLKYNPDATHIEIEPIDNGSGGLLHCKIKLFYGEKDYEFWEGIVAAWINQVEDPFLQYNPERNAALYHKVGGLGEKAVYISNMHQLQILKDGVMYSITSPNRGRTTNTGKENKEIAIEIAEYYKL